MDIYERIKAITGSARSGAERAAPRDGGPVQPPGVAKRVLPAGLDGLLVTGRQLRERDDGAADRRGDALAPLAGETVETPAGPCWRRRSLLGYGEPHGRRTLAGVRELDWEAILRLARESAPGPVDPRRVAIVDTETTGLAGGAGTFAFLVGLAFLDRDGLVVEQYFMRDYCEELAQMTALCEALVSRGIDTVVSYNGKAFDLPLLAGRFVQNRLPNPLDGVVHVDLLHTARRLWKLRLGSCDLACIEREVLGVERVGDVPGSLIPRIYFDFVRGIAPQRIVPVFHHNLLDVVSLAGLLDVLVEWDRDYLSDCYPQADRFCLGRTYEVVGITERAAQIYERLLEEGFDDTGEDALLRLAIIYKRLGDQARAVELWGRSIRQASGFNPVPYEELAKYYEHKAKDLDRARAVVEEALACVELETWVDSDPFEDAPDRPPVAERFRHRLLRIERKRLRAKSRPGAGEGGG